MGDVVTMQVTVQGDNSEGVMEPLDPMYNLSTESSESDNGVNRGCEEKTGTTISPRVSR